MRGALVTALASAALGLSLPGASGCTVAPLVASQAESEGSRVEPEQARELGRVRWQRQLEPALATSKETDKPVLLLFQEVPG